MVGKINANGIVVRRGDSFDIVMKFKSKTAQKFDLIGCNIKMAVKNIGDLRNLFIVNGEIIDENQGIARIKLMPSHTKITPKDYICDIQLTLKNGDVHTVFPSNIAKTAIFRITEDVTEG